MFCDLGDHAPPYIAIGMGISMIAFLLGNIKQYRDDAVNIYKVEFFFGICLWAYIYGFAIASIVLITASVSNIFFIPCSIKTVIQMVVKVSLGVCAFCLLYSLLEYLRKYREELLDKD
jgi:hypothetical protein